MMGKLIDIDLLMLLHKMAMDTSNSILQLVYGRNKELDKRGS